MNNSFSIKTILLLFTLGALLLPEGALAKTKEDITYITYDLGELSRPVGLKGSVASIVEKSWDWNTSFGEYTQADCVDSTTYIFDSNGRYQTIVYSDDSHDSYFYNDNGKISKISYFQENDETTGFKEFVYQGNLLKYVNTYSISDQNQSSLTHKTCVARSGSIVTVYDYDGNGEEKGWNKLNLKTLSGIDSKDAMFKFNSRRQQTYVEQTVNTWGQSLTVFEKCTFDANGNPTAKLSGVSANDRGYSSSKSTNIKWIYKFDAKGNWISKKKYKDGELQYWRTRSITYRANSQGSTSKQKYTNSRTRRK